jgi:hypothetical protein
MDSEAGFLLMHQWMDPFHKELPWHSWSHCTTAGLAFSSSPNKKKYISFK